MTSDAKETAREVTEALFDEKPPNVEKAAKLVDEFFEQVIDEAAKECVKKVLESKP